MKRKQHPKWEVVGHCPACGAPIWCNRREAVAAPPESRYSCACRFSAASATTGTITVTPVPYMPVPAPAVPWQPSTPWSPTIICSETRTGPATGGLFSTIGYVDAHPCGGVQ